MRPEVYNYDIFPKVFLTGVGRTITVKPPGAHVAFRAGNLFRVAVKNVQLAEGRRPAHPAHRLMRYDRTNSVACG